MVVKNGKMTVNNSIKKREPFVGEGNHTEGLTFFYF